MMVDGMMAGGKGGCMVGWNKRGGCGEQWLDTLDGRPCETCLVFAILVVGS